MTEPMVDAVFARWVAARLTRPASCPDSEMLFLFASGAISDATAQEACVQHLAMCVDCRSAVQMVFASEVLAADLAKDLEAVAVPNALSPSADILPIPAKKTRSRRLWPLGLAAAAALVLTVLIAPWRENPDFGAVRAPISAAVLPADQAVLQAPPTVLRWPCTVAADRYEVSLLDAAAEPIWNGQTSACEIALDAAVFTNRRGSFYWRVTPGIDDAPSSVFAFELQ